MVEVVNVRIAVSCLALCAAMAGCEGGATIGNAPHVVATGTVGGGATSAPSGSASAIPGTGATASPSAAASGTGSSTASLLGGGKIQHVVVVIMENRTVDNLFNGFPGADTVTTAPISDGTSVALVPELLEAPCDPDHSHTGWETVYDNGKSDGWDKSSASCSAVTNPIGGVPYVGPKYPNLAYVPQTEAQPYWDIASQFAFANRMFASHSGPSYPGHLYIVSAQAQNQIDDPNSLIWGCDAPAGTTVNVLGAGGTIVGTAFPCMDEQTVADRMDQANIPWKYYSNNEDVDVTGEKTEEDTVPYDAIKHIREGPDWTNGDFTLDDSEFLTDVASGTLRPMNWLNPPIVASDHPGGATEGDTGLGPDYNATIVNDVMQSATYKDNTVIIITWDDFGGFFDHVTPHEIDDDGLGYRVPMLVISRYAKHGYISNVQHEYGSIVKFCDEVFGVPGLGATDTRSDDLSDMFDFNQPAPTFTPIAVSAAHFGRSRNAAQAFFTHYHTEHGKLDSE
jgi:phospholipase C